MQVVGSSKPVSAGPFKRTAHLLVSWRLLRLAAPAYIALMLAVWGVLFYLWFGGTNGRDRSGVVLGPDFPAFYTGGLLVRQGSAQELYDLEQQRALQHLFVSSKTLSAYVNPPHYAFVAIPFSMLPYGAAFLVWSACMVSAFVASISLLRSILPALRGSSGSLLCALALLAAPVYYALSAGQNTGLSLLLHSGILLALAQRRDGLAGLLIALGLFKPQLFVVLLPLLLLGKHWRALASFSIAALLLGGLTLWFWGWAAVHDWVAVLRSPLYQSEEVRQASKMFSWQPLWLLVFGQGLLANMLGWTCAAAVFVGLGWIWWRGTGDVLLRYAITLLGMIVIGPHLPVYDLALLILPGLVLIDRLLRWPAHEWVELRVSLLAVYVLTLFAANAELQASLVLVPCITLLGCLATHLLLAARRVPAR